MNSSKLINAKKEALKHMILSQEPEEKYYSIRFYPTECLQAELDRRERYVNSKLMYLWDSAATITDDMTLNKKETLLNEVIATVNKKDSDS